MDCLFSDAFIAVIALFKKDLDDLTKMVVILVIQITEQYSIRKANTEGVERRADRVS